MSAPAITNEDKAALAGLHWTFSSHIKFAWGAQYTFRCEALKCTRVSITRNIFAWRSTDPKVLPKVDDPVGPFNDAAIVESARWSDMVVCAWGKDGSINDRGAKVLALLHSYGVKPKALKLNGDGQPAHPLYLPYSLMPFPI